MIYIRQTLQGMQVEVLNLNTSRSRAIFSVNKGSGRFLWTTAIFANRRYFTVYNSHHLVDLPRLSAAILRP